MLSMTHLHLMPATTDASIDSPRDRVIFLQFRVFSSLEPHHPRLTAAQNNTGPSYGMTQNDPE